MTDGQKKQIALLRKEGCGYAAIAKRLELSKDTVKSFCRRNGLAGEMADSGAAEGGRCRECGKALIQTEGMKRRVFCCGECRKKWWREHPDQIRQKAVYSFACACCGKGFTAYGNSHRKYCSHECYIKARFKGGDADG